jgi:hypothetical protein
MMIIAINMFPFSAMENETQAANYEKSPDPIIDI